MAAMTVSGYSATVDDSGASVSDRFSEYKAAKSYSRPPAGEGGPAGPDEG